VTSFGFDARVILALQCEFGSIPSSSNFERVSEGLKLFL
jgi:hypothetical protein